MTTLGWAPQIPDNWDVVPLNFVAKMGTGHTPDRSKPEYWENCTTPWITLTDASRHGQSLDPLMETYQQISPLGLRNSAAVLHPAGTVVLSRTASVGHSAIMGRPMATSQDFATWICGPRIDPRYLLLVLRAMKPEWERLAFGSTHRTIYMPDLEALRVPLPAIGAQEAIADYVSCQLGQLDVLSSTQSRSLELLAELRARTIQDSLIGQNAWQPLARAVDPYRPVVYGIIVPGPNVPGGVPYVKGGDIAQGRLRLDVLSRASVEVESAYSRARLRSGDVLIAIRGSGTIGEVARVPQELAGANLTQDSARISPAQGVEGDWLELVLQAPSITAQINARVTGSSIKGINLWDLRRVAIPRRTREEQLRDLSRLRPRLNSIDELVALTRRQLTVLADRRRALITAAVTGQIDVTAARGAVV